MSLLEKSVVLMPSSSAPLAWPLTLLLASGAGFATVYALSKPLIAAGIPALLLLFLQMLGGGILVLFVAVFRRQRPKLSPPLLRYYAIGGLGVTVPNGLLYIVIPHVGVGIASTLTSLSPLFTWSMARLLGMEPHSARRILGLATGFAGAVLLALRSGAPGSGMGGAFDGWILLGLLAPLGLAFGNIYRTRAWPRGEPPLPLTAGMLIAGGILVVPVALATGAFAVPTALLAANLPLILLQVALYAVSGILIYEMQRIAGPVFLSQLGYVIPPIGLAWGLGVFGETLSPLNVAGLGLIAAGLLLINLRRNRG